MNPRILIIDIPHPHKVLTPNGRTRVAAYRRRIAREYREHACKVAMAEQGAARPMNMKAARVQIISKHHRKYTGDGDNTLAGLKAALDGLADSGLVTNDRNFTYPPVKFEKVPKTEAVGIRLIIEEIVD